MSAKPLIIAPAAPGGQIGVGGAIPAPAQKPSADQTALVRLLRVEGEARAAKSPDELKALIANETQLLLRARLCFVVAPGVTGRLEIAAGSSLSHVDRNAPLLQSIELELARLALAISGGAIRPVQLWQEAAPNVKPAARPQDYPFRDALWMPLQGRSGALLGGALLLRDEAWQKNDIVLAQRLAVSFAQAWHWQASTGASRSRFAINRTRAAIAGVAAVLVSVFPVSLTTLAPMEIVARDPFIVTAPMDGIIESIPVAPSSLVAKGDVLVRFSSTLLKNRFEVAEREVEVADSRVKKTMLAAVSDMRARHDLVVAQAELTVKVAERDYARDMLGRTIVTAERAGLAVFGDKRDLLGKPTATGERIMEIADPNEVDIRIGVPVGDAIVLGDDKRAKIFLDSAPLHPRTAKVTTSDYHAKSQDGGAYAFRVTARFDDQNAAPRLGLRGAAQLYGGRVPLIYYVLRRPLTAARQWIGL
jgi:hypothetical protein